MATVKITPITMTTEPPTAMVMTAHMGRDEGIASGGRTEGLGEGVDVVTMAVKPQQYQWHLYKKEIEEDPAISKVYGKIEKRVGSRDLDGDRRRGREELE